MKIACEIDHNNSKSATVDVVLGSGLGTQVLYQAYREACEKWEGGDVSYNAVHSLLWNLRVQSTHLKRNIVIKEKETGVIFRFQKEVCVRGRQIPFPKPVMSLCRLYSY